MQTGGQKFHRLEETALKHAAEFSWENQARRHYELAEHILSQLLTRLVLYSPLKVDIVLGKRIGLGIYARCAWYQTV